MKFKKKIKKNKQIKKAPIFNTTDVIKVILGIPRQTIEANDYKTVYQLVYQILTQTPRYALENILTIKFEGYDDDHRELFEIPEIRTFMRALDSEFPCWFYLADLQTDTLGVITLMLCDNVVNETIKTRIPTQEFQKFCQHQELRLRNWGMCAEIPFSDLKKRGYQISKYYEQFFNNVGAA